METTKHNSSRLRRILFLVVGVLISTLALEGALYLATLVSPQAAAVLDRHAGLLLPDATLIHRPNPAYPEHDAWGFRNATVPDSAFAVALGDSQTYGAMVPPDEAWPQQLAQAIGEPVYNMAFGGYGAGEASLLLDQALELEPQWILYGLYAGNDLFDAYELAYKTDALAAQRSSDPEVLESIERAEANGAIETAFRETHSLRASIKEWFVGHSKLYGLARALRNSARGSAWQETDTDWDAIVKQHSAHPEWMLVNNDVSPTVLKPAYRLLALNREDPRIREGERITFVLLSEMSKRCAEAGAQFAVVALPTKELVYRDVVLAAGGEIGRELDQVWRDEIAFWAACKVACAANDIPFIDPLAELRERLHVGGGPFRQDFDGHLTRVGNEVVRDAVQSRIAPNAK